MSAVYWLFLNKIEIRSLNVCGLAMLSMNHVRVGTGVMPYYICKANRICNAICTMKKVAERLIELRTIDLYSDQPLITHMPSHSPRSSSFPLCT